MTDFTRLRQLSPYEEMCSFMNIGVALKLSSTRLRPEKAQIALQLTAQEHPYLRLTIQSHEGNLFFFDQAPVPDIQVNPRQIAALSRVGHGPCSCTCRLLPGASADYQTSTIVAGSAEVRSRRWQPPATADQPAQADCCCGVHGGTLPANGAGPRKCYLPSIIESRWN